MKPATLVLAVAVTVLSFTTWYQGRVLEQQRQVIRLMMTNPCVPLRVN